MTNYFLLEGTISQPLSLSPLTPQIHTAPLLKYKHKIPLDVIVLLFNYKKGQKATAQSAIVAIVLIVS